MSAASPKLTVILADESVLLREGLALLCESLGRYRVIAQCSDGEQAYSLISTLKPDIAILDHGLARIVCKLREAGCQSRLLILSSRQDRQFALESVRSGANGYLLKSCQVRELQDALEHAMDGAVWIDPHVAADPLESLSRREHQVFDLLVEGLRAKEIAARLEVSSKTVDTHRANLMRKLEIDDLAGLVKFAIDRKLTSS